jgi:hypothetical protein
MAALPLASDDIGPGGAGFLVVILLIVAAALIFWAMSGSLKRLRKSVERGTFGQPREVEQAKPAESRAIEDESDPAAGVRSDPGGPGDAGA